MRFADIQILRYELPGWETLTLREKRFIFCIAEATLWGRDITFCQFGRHNLDIRRLMEAVCQHLGLTSDATSHNGNPALSTAVTEADSTAMLTYLRRVWFSSGIYHHYSCRKMLPGFSQQALEAVIDTMSPADLPLHDGETIQQMKQRLMPVMFQPDLFPTRVDHSDGVDHVQNSANDFYRDVTQAEATAFYEQLRNDYRAAHPDRDADELPSFGLNTRLVKDADGTLHEDVCKADGLYGPYIVKIVEWLTRALEFAGDEQQRKVVQLLIDYYTTGDLQLFDQYSIAWVQQTHSKVDFINGFIEVYADAIGLKGSWEGIVHYRDEKATLRARTLSDNAQWFEDHSPVLPQFRKPIVKGVTANVVCAAMLGGDEYPSTAIGINLPNADWIRARHGSKSITISNLTEAYDRAARGNGFRQEFIPSGQHGDAIGDVLAYLDAHNDEAALCDNLHTDLHECLGHGSGQLLPGVAADALKTYQSTIEEARADLFGLYYIADPMMQQLGLITDPDVYRLQYYTYMLNGLMTQTVRIPLGEDIQEAHMRNRALIARWAYAHSGGAVKMVDISGKTSLVITDYALLRSLFAQLLAEVQRIKSEGDYEAARSLVEDYGVTIDPTLHHEMLTRYKALNIAPYKGFLNPVFTEVTDPSGNVIDVTADLTETYDHQMLRYSRAYNI